MTPRTTDPPLVFDAQPLCVHLVPHTHWDREWYRTTESFRVGLIALVDEVLARRSSFLLDGQAIVLEDFLDWAPDRKVAVAAAVQEGWLEAGPWYVLADNSIPGGEALVRNLTIGSAMLSSLGATPPAVLYCPDTFGHPAAGPTLASGFGLPAAVVWRGYGGRGWPAGDTARWRNEAGDEVLLHHLPAAGYEFGSSLPTGQEPMVTRWRSMRDCLAPRSASGHLLILNGADHHAVQPGLGDARAALVAAAAPIPVVEMGLAWFARAQLDFASSRAFPVASGELRGSPGYVWTLGGTMGSRAYQKRRNAQLERLLSQEVEPWLALSGWRGTVHGSEALNGLWRLLLSSHPHDTLCGCSIDDVAAAMDDRSTRVTAGGRALRESALGYVVGVTAERPSGLEAPRLLVTNPVPRRRTGVVEATVDLPLAVVPIGFGSASAAVPPREVPRWSVHRDGAVPMQRLTSQRIVVRDEAPTRYPVTRLVDRHQVLLWLDGIPAHGFSTLDVVERAGRARPPVVVRADGEVLDNGTVRVWWDDERGLCCRTAAGEWRDLLGFEAEGERGDLYTHSVLLGTRQTGTCRSARVTIRGPLRGEISIRIRVPIAARTVAQPTGTTRRHRKASTNLTVRVALDAGAPWFRLVIAGMSKAHDYRLRAVVRTTCHADVHRADAAFTPVTRPSRPMESQEGDVEQVAGTAPLHRYVSCFDAAAGRGLTVYSDGLAEYEATPDGAIAVTLLRAVGELSRADLPERPGHAGYPSPVPHAQCEGPFHAMLALLPHGADHPGTHGRIESVADDVLLPPGASPVRAHAGMLLEGLRVDGEGIRWLGTRPGDSAGSLRVRLANVTARTQNAVLTLAGVAAARRLRLDDTPIGVLQVSEHRVRCAISPHAVATIECLTSVLA